VEVTTLDRDPLRATQVQSVAELAKVDRFPIDDDDDDEPTPLPTGSPKKGTKWLVLGAFFELIGDLFKAFHGFFDSLTEESLAKYRAERYRQAFAEQASREIEMLTSGKYDATSTDTSRGQRSGTSFEED
jgi:hypothetical protein